MKKRIALSKKLFGISTDQLRLVVGGGGVIVQQDREVNGIGTSPSEEVVK